MNPLDFTLKDILESVVDFLVNTLGAEILLLSFLFFLRLLGIDLYYKIWSLVHLAYLSFLAIQGRKVIFLYTDCDDQFTTTKNLASRIEKCLNLEKNQAERAKVIPLEEPASLLIWPLVHSAISSIIIIITDVTPLSTNKIRRRKIQEKLLTFTQTGGILVLGHDVIYRRTRNEILEKLAGCKLTGFIRQEEISYVKNTNKNSKRISDNKILLEHLPDSFSLSDREYVVGNWREGVEFLYTHSENQDIPLVTRRVVQKGAAFWINSGDHVDHGPPRSVSRPSEALVFLLSQIIAYGI